MITYNCPSCSFSFTQADKAWDVAVASKCCPKCKIALVNFNVPAPVLTKKESKINQETQPETIADVFEKQPITFMGSLIYSISFITSLLFGTTIFWSQKHMGFVSIKESPILFFIGFTISAIIFFFTVRWLWRYYKLSLTHHSSGTG